MGVYIWNKLPSEYQEVEYIQSSGNCIIEIGGFTLSGYEKIQCKFNPVSFASDGNVPFFYGTVPDGGNYLCINIAKTHFQVGAGSSGIVTTVPIATNTDYETETILDNGSLTFTANGTTYTGTYSGSLGTAKFSLFCRYRSSQDGYTYYSQNMKLYYFKLYNSSSNLVRDMIPCYRIADGVIGLYDLVNNQFYTNAGTGTFTKGSDVNNYYEKEMQNAYIGKVIEISSDLRGATLAGLQAQGWDGITSANSGYTLNSSGLTPGTTNSNNNVLLYKYLPELSENSIITLHMTGYATRAYSSDSYRYNTIFRIGLFNNSDASDTYIIGNNSIGGAYSACGSTQVQKTGIDYYSSGALTVLGTAGTGNVAGNVNMTTKINLNTGLVEYTLTSPQTHSTSATLNSTQLALVRSLKYVGVVIQPKDKSNTPTLYTVDLTVE